MDTGDRLIMNSSLVCEKVIEDQINSRLWVRSSEGWTIYGVNVTINGVIIYGDYIDVSPILP